MRLAAVYIKDHFLFNKPQTINFGGKYIYSFSDKDKIEIVVTRMENKNFIQSFWGENISLVSGINLMAFLLSSANSTNSFSFSFEISLSEQ